MAIARLINREYSNYFRPEKTDFLIGNVGDFIAASYTFEVEIQSESGLGNDFVVTNNDTITRNSGSWFDDGFVNGATLTITGDNNGTPINVTADITVLSPSVMTVNVTAGTLLNGTYPSAADNNSNLLIVSDTGIESIEMEFALIQNSNSTSSSIAGLIDGTTSNWKYNSVDTMVVSGSENMDAYGFQSSHAVVIPPKVTYVADNGTSKEYTVRIVFAITPFWEFLTDLENQLNPSFFFDTDCITDKINVKFFPQLGNPNIVIEPDTTQTQRLGNTGWFNENNNGGNNNFSVVSLELFNPNSIPVANIQTNFNTDFTLIIDDPNNTSLSEYSIGWLWTPDDPALYSNTTEYFQENCMMSTYGSIIPLTENSPSAVNGGSSYFRPRTNARMLIRFNSLVRSGNNVIIKGRFEPSQDFGTYIDSLGGGSLNYVFWVSAGQESLTTTQSDRVSLLAQYGTLDTTTTAAAPTNVSTSFIEHPQPVSQVGVATYEGAVEDEVVGRSIILVNTQQNEEIEEIVISVEGFNISDQRSYVLEETTFDATTFPKDSNGIQQIDIDTTRGFKMAAGVDKNEIKIYRDASQDTATEVAYRSNYAFRLRWEDWIENLNVDNDFFNNTQLNNGLNQDWATKADITNWKLTFNVNLRINRNGTIVNTKASSDIVVRDYEESNIYDGQVTLYNFDKTTSLFVGVNSDGIRENTITNNANTWIEIDFDLEDTLGDVGDINDYYGVIRMEEYRNGGITAIDMLSSILTNETATNLLIPLTGESAAKLTKVSNTKIRLEGYIDYTKLPASGVTYKISGRLGAKNIDLGKYSSHYSLKYD